jgi:hypothetical protein
MFMQFCNSLTLLFHLPCLSAFYFHRSKMKARKQRADRRGRGRGRGEGEGEGDMVRSTTLSSTGVRWAV